MPNTPRPRIGVDLVDPFDVTEIVDKDNYLSHLNVKRNVCDPATNAFSGVGETVLPVDFSGLPDARIMKADPGTSVPSHSHEGPVFRIIMEGEAVVNGKSYREGDWMVVPDGVMYGIESASGYTALWNCTKC